MKIWGTLVFIVWNVKESISSCQVHQSKKNISKMKQRRAKQPNLQTKKAENVWTPWERVSDKPFFSLHVPPSKCPMLRKQCMKTNDTQQINNLHTTFLYLWKFLKCVQKRGHILPKKYPTPLIPTKPMIIGVTNQFYKRAHIFCHAMSFWQAIRGRTRYFKATVKK